MSLMPFIKSLIFKCIAYCFKLVTMIFLFSKIIPSYSYYIEKGLVYIIIIAPFSRQLSSYMKCTYTNIQLFCNIYLVFNIKYTSSVLYY